MNCPRCTAPFAEGDQFCTGCGAPLTGSPGVPWWRRPLVLAAAGAVVALAALGFLVAPLLRETFAPKDDPAAKLSIPADAPSGAAGGGAGGGGGRPGGAPPSPGKSLADELRPDAIRGQVIELGRRTLKLRSLSTGLVYEVEVGRRTRMVPRRRLEVGERVVVTYRVGFRGRLAATQIERD